MTKQDIDQYLQKMNKFNTFEREELKNMSAKEKLDVFFRLLEYTYQVYSQEQIESFHQEKIAHLVHTQKILRLMER